MKCHSEKFSHNFLGGISSPKTDVSVSSISFFQLVLAECSADVFVNTATYRSIWRHNNSHNQNKFFSQYTLNNSIQIRSHRNSKSINVT